VRGLFKDVHGEMTFDLDDSMATRFSGEFDAAVEMDVTYLGQWESPFWVGDENRGAMKRIGFEARTTINRHDFGISWQDNLPRGGVVVGNEIALTFDVEAINEDDLEATGAISYYR